MKKHLISIILALCMIISLFTVVGMSANAKTNVVSLKFGENEATLYDNIYDAWNEVLNVTEESKVTITLLDNVALSSSLVYDDKTYSIELTLDLNDKVLTAENSFDGNLIKINSNTFRLLIVDTSSEKTEKFFNVSESGLWTLTKTKTDDTKVVSGGIITGSKSTAVKCETTNIELRDISFVGNQGDYGGALYCSPTFFSNSCNIYNVNFFGNSASKNGGAIFFYKDLCSLLYNCNVKYNLSGKGGAGIFILGNYEIGNFDGNCNVIIGTTITDNKAGLGDLLAYDGLGGGVRYQYTLACCFVEGTLVTMADGTRKAIENIKEGEMVKTFDHESGTFSSAPVFIAWKGYEPQESFKLTFEGGISVKCLASHDFLQKESMKYVTLSQYNAENYIGSHFFGEDGKWHKLESVTVEEREDYLYEVYSEKHINSFANGMLTCPTDMDYMLNLYELDDNLKADENQLKADIDKYGLTSYETASTVYGLVDKEWFEATNAKYNKIVMGKGLASLEYLLSLFNDSVDNDLINSEALNAPNIITLNMPDLLSAPLKTTIDILPSIDDYTGIGSGNREYLIIGKGTVIKNNTYNGERNNLYIVERSDVKLDEDHSDIDIWVTMENPESYITDDSAYENDEYLFHSDDPNYDVIFELSEDPESEVESGYLLFDDGYFVTEDDCVGGKVDVGEQKSFAEGKTVSVTPIEDEGYKLEKVFLNDGEKEKELLLIDGKYSFTMLSQEMKVRATFKKIDYKIESSQVIDNKDKNNGYIEFTSSTYQFEDTVILKIYPNNGYKIGELFYEVNGEKVNIPINENNEGCFEMPAGDIKVVAVFTKNSSSIEFDSDSLSSCNFFSKIIGFIKDLFTKLFDLLSVEC